MRNKLSQKITLNFKIKEQKHEVNIGLIIVVIIASVITWFLAEFIVYELNEMDFAWADIFHPSAIGATQDCYIDFATGNDNNSGTEEGSAWKHHPWDVSLSSASTPVINRGKCKNYYFKKGVIYRGSLKALDSGEAGSPIVLSSWGDGNAQIFGSERFTTGWAECKDEECAEIPQAARAHVWYRDTTPDFSHTPMMVYELQGDNVTKLNIARSPNWAITNPDDPRTGWWEFSGYTFQRTLELDDTSGFALGDQIYNSSYAPASRGITRIYEIGVNFIKTATTEVAAGDFAVGNRITNGTVTHTISKLTVLETKYEDEVNLSGMPDDYWKDGIVWYEDYAFWPRNAKILSFNSNSHEISFKGIRDQYINKEHYRYFIEGLPQLLDTANEWVYINSGPHAGRIYLMLSNGRSPNDTTLEIAREQHFLEIEEKQYITVQGLEMEFFNGVNFLGDPQGYSPRYADFARANNPEYSTSVIRITGNSSNITVSDCDIKYSSQGIGFFPNGKNKLLHHLTFENNRIAHMEANAINGLLGEGMGMLQWAWSWWPPQQSRIRYIEINHNNIDDTGLRALTWNPTGAIGLYDTEMAEVSYNQISNTATPGINIAGPGYWDNTKGYWEGYEGMDYPLQRILVHHNTLENTCLMNEDMGGLEVWHGGPTYVYDNISGNAIGEMYGDKTQHPTRTKYYRTGAFAPAFYSDNGYKNYVFNNIFWGKNNNEEDFIYNSVGYNDYDSDINTVFNNTIYNCAVGIHKGGGTDNRNYYLNNLIINTGERYISDRVTDNSELDSIAYAYNIFNDHGGSIFGMLQLDQTMVTYDDFVEKLTEKQSLSLNPGKEVSGDQVINETGHDFHLKSGSLAIDAGKKVFVPWGLYQVAGEWGFYKNRADITRIMDEHINWNEDWWSREEVWNGRPPRMDLTASEISAINFQNGILEEWIEGALRLNGSSQYLSRANGSSGLLNMNSNNLLIEAVLKIDNSESKGGIVEKTDGAYGYSLCLENGKVIMELEFGKNSCSRISAKNINDGAWHHILAQADRSDAQGINIYIDGQLSNDAFTGTMNSTQSLTNSSDFIVGRAGANEYLAGTFDFLRISRGTLEDAQTTINELYDWEFNGPFLKDFYGNALYGASRDAGAVEYVPQNQAPKANAGADQSITLPQVANLSGQSNDDGLPNPPGALTMGWSKVSGPGQVTFANAASANTAASFSLIGTYVLRFSANDSLLSANDEVSIMVNSAPSSSGNGGGGGAGGGSNSNPTNPTGDKDTLAPAVIKNLNPVKITNASITLNWTSPGDDNNSGKAAEYDIRYSTSPITNQNWDKAIKMGTKTNPKNAGSAESVVISNLEPDKNYYFAIKTKDEANNWSEVSSLAQAKTLKKENSDSDLSTNKGENNNNQTIPNISNCQGKGATNLFGESQEIAECLSREEAKEINGYDKFVPLDNTGKGLYLKITQQSNISLTIPNKYSLAMFIHYGTGTTKRLGQGERAGVINSYIAAFNRTPRTENEWQDVIKIANGRWPKEANKTKEEKVKQEIFNKIYKRIPNMNNAHDNAAVTIITYGLRPVNRNTESEKRGIIIFKGIYGYNPQSALDWDIVRAIAYSGAKR